MPDPVLLIGEPQVHPMIFYRSGFLAPDPVIYFEDHTGKGTLLVSRLEFGRATREARGATVRSFEDFNFTEIQKELPTIWDCYAEVAAGFLREIGVERVRCEPDLAVAIARGLEARDVVVDADRPLFLDQRRRKQPHEVEAIQASQQAAEAAMARAQDLIHRAIPDNDGYLEVDGEVLTSRRLIAAIEGELLGRGYAAEGTIAAGGAGAADPHCSDSGPLRAEEPIIVDIFPSGKVSHYFGDITRTFHPGRPSETWLRMYAAVADAHARALAKVRAGANGRDIHLAVCAALYEAGFGTVVDGFRREGVPTMIHGTGHALGLEIHEYPRVSDLDVTLLEGEVITIEPGLYSQEHGGVRIEDTVMVTADGHRNLTVYPKEWTP
ncbi:MAG: M24 family metallopeptidase [Candidatus Dormibacteria bacterium]